MLGYGFEIAFDACGLLVFDYISDGVTTLVVCVNGVNFGVLRKCGMNLGYEPGLAWIVELRCLAFQFRDFDWIQVFEILLVSC